METDCTFKTHITTDTTIICESVQNILFFLQKHIAIPDDQIFEVKVILNELLINAMIHGNKNNPSKKVYIEVCICNNQIYVIVEDEGEGVYETKIEKLSSKHLQQNDILYLDECGRGLKIVSSLCSSIKRNEKGNRVTVVKKITN